MKANAPEKIYLTTNENDTHYYTEGIPFEREYVEYIRKDAIIENLNEKMIAKYLYEKKGYPIDLNGNIPLFDETMKDAEKYLKYKQDKFIEKALKQIRKEIRPYYSEVKYKYKDFKKYIEE